MEKEKLFVLDERCNVLGVIFDPFPPCDHDIFDENYDIVAKEKESEEIWARIRTQFPGAWSLSEGLMSSTKDSRISLAYPKNYAAVELK